MNRLRYIIIAVLLIVLLVFAVWRSDFDPHQPDVLSGEAGAGDAILFKNKPREEIGKPLSSLVKKTFWMPFVGDLTLPSRSERLTIKVGKTESVDLDVTTYFDNDGRVCRLEYSRNSNWARKWTAAETESVYQSRSEMIHGLFSGPYTFTWQKVIDLLRADVNLAAAKHFNMTRVDFGYGEERIEVFICNVYGARGFFDPYPGEDDNNKVRYLVIPSRDETLVDDLL